MKNRFIVKALCVLGVFSVACRAASFSITPTATFPSPTLEPPTQTPTPRVLFLRMLCGDTYTVPADTPLEFHYGAWGAVGKDLAKQNAQHLTIRLVFDGQPVIGVQQPVVPFSNFPCGSPEPEFYGVFYKAYVGPLRAGTHTASVTFILDEQVTDGYDSDHDGDSDLYGPGEVTTHEFTIIAK